MTKPWILLLLASTLLLGCQNTPSFKAQPKAPRKPLNQLSDQKLAQIARGSGDYQTSIRLYNKLLQLEPNKLVYKLELAQVYRQAKQPNLAIKLVAPELLIGNKGAVPTQQKAEGNDQVLIPSLWQVLGSAYLDIGNYFEAKKAFEQSTLGIDANTPTEQVAARHNGLGVAASWLQQYDLAKASFDKAIALAPEHIQYTSNLALNYVLQQQYSAAVKLLQPLYMQGLTSPVMRQHLALALVKLGEFNRARSVLNQDLSVDEVEQNIRYFDAIAQQNKDKTTKPQRKVN